FLAYVHNAKDFFSFKIETASSKWDTSTLQGKANAINDILSTAMKMPDIIKRNLLIKWIAEHMSIDEATLRIQLKKFNKHASFTDEKQTASQRLDASFTAERELLYLMLSCNELIPRVLEEIGLEEFNNRDLFKIAGKIVELYRKNTVVKEEDVLHMLDDVQLNKVLMDIITKKEFQHITNQDKRLEACIHFFKRRNSKKERHQAKEKMLKTIMASNNEEDLLVSLDEFHRKSKNIHIIKNKT
ncbi:MAG: hypothetical protein F9K48_05320, partial [Candidatus Brocadia sp.]